MLNEEKELLAALLRLFIANPTGNPLTRGQMMDAAKVALAALTVPEPESNSEPVSWQFKCDNGTWANIDNHGRMLAIKYGKEVRALYTAPLVLADLLPNLHDIPDGHDLTSCMAGAAWYQQQLKHRLNLLDGGKWKMVPVEPTEDMVIYGFESKPRQIFSDAADWEEFEAMSGCQQAAHIATLCYKAMLAAAPEAPC